MPRQITVVLLDKEPSSTEHYVELLREELIRRLKPSNLWVAGVEVVEVQEQQEAQGEPNAIVKQV